MMADQIGKCVVNNTLLSLNTSSIKEKDNYVDEKIYVSETSIMINNLELQDHMRRQDKIKEYEVATEDNIKAELASNTIIDSVKIEEGIRISDTNIEFDNGLLYCERCQSYYEDYCIKCGMLVHILNRNAPDNSDNSTQEELPNNILEIQHLFVQCGILALKVIPEGVKFGPFTGLCRTECAWKIKAGKFVVDEDRSQVLNWMQYVNTARNIFDRNLIVFQCEDYLYYRSTRLIQPGEELLVYLGEEFVDSLHENVEVDFIPMTEHMSEDVFACTFCSLGFSSISYLAEHRTICRGNGGSSFLSKELAPCSACPFCKIHFGQEEYLEHHFSYCSERSRRICNASTLSRQVTVVNGRKTRRNPLYKCEQCKYKTKYKADLKKHTNSQHYKVKRSKCGICYRRFKTKEYLMFHMENTHISVGEKAEPAHSICDYVNRHIKIEQSNSQGQTKRFKCALCGLQTKHKHSLTRHIKSKHLKGFDYKCDTCEYRADRKALLERHIKAKHLKKFDYKCDSCEFRTNWKNALDRHINVKHLKQMNIKCASCEYRTNNTHTLKCRIKTNHLTEFDYKCASCEYRTNNKHNLEKHIKTKHLKEFNYKCDSCEYRANSKHNLECHIKAEHLEEFSFKCDSCEFRTNSKTHLNLHINTKHLKVFNLKCDSCEYRTNDKRNLDRHIKAKHLKEFNRKCDYCEYCTNIKNNLKMHIKTKHLKEVNFKCDLCDYGTNHKYNFKVHIKAKHLKEYNFKCDLCEYGTNRKYNLEIHVKAKHLKEFNYKCDSCEYGTNEKHSLEYHVKTIHLNEYDYLCDSCAFRTNRKGTLKLHIKSKHSKEFDFKCDSCDYRTNRKHRLEQHMKTKHL